MDYGSLERENKRWWKGWNTRLANQEREKFNKEFYMKLKQNLKPPK